MSQSFEFRGFGPRRLTDKLSFPLFRLRLAVSAFTSLLVIGTCGYHLIERWSFLDSVFMTVITLAAVGFGEVHRLDDNGKIFTIFLIMFGVGIAAWALFTMVEVFVSEAGIRDLERRRMRRLISSMKNHYIVCGYGRIGRSIVKGYVRNNVPHVVVESDPERVEAARADSVPYIEGDATSDEVLELAGIASATGLIAVTPNDALNTFVVLTARGLREDLMIVVRADSQAAIPKLYRAGANKVVSHHALGGWWMAVTAINPAVTDFMEGLSLADQRINSMFEFVASEALNGVPFGSLEFKSKTGALVLAIRRGGEFIANPQDTFPLVTGDALIVLGSPAQLRKMAPLCNPGAPMTIKLPFELFE
ncbi:MAG: NAD-binding protein [Capsulimonadaceae bacterium]|nr:NAD-binding protein [Capsulimonadaceae bacterium]